MHMHIGFAHLRSKIEIKIRSHEIKFLAKNNCFPRNEFRGHEIKFIRILHHGNIFYFRGREFVDHCIAELPRNFRRKGCKISFKYDLL